MKIIVWILTLTLLASISHADFEKDTVICERLAKRLFDKYQASKKEKEFLHEYVLRTCLKAAYEKVSEERE